MWYSWLRYVIKCCFVRIKEFLSSPDYSNKKTLVKIHGKALKNQIWVFSRPVIIWVRLFTRAFRNTYTSAHVYPPMLVHKSNISYLLLVQNDENKETLMIAVGTEITTIVLKMRSYLCANMNWVFLVFKWDMMYTRAYQSGISA